MSVSRVNHLGFLVGMISILFSAGCGGNNTGVATAASNLLAGAFPTGLAFSAPMAVVSPVPTSTPSPSPSPSPTASVSPTPSATPVFDTTLPYSSKVSALNTIIGGASAAACQILLPNFTATSSVPCYGPSLYYSAYPGATNTGTGSLAIGDLGIWSSTTATGESCTSAKLNGLMSDVARKEDAALLMAAAVICVMRVNTMALPTPGDPATDVTALMNSAVQVNNSSVKLTSATFTNLEVSGSNPEYQITIAGTLAVGTSSVALSYNLLHMSTASDNSTYEGKLWGSMLGFPAGGSPLQVNQFFTLGYQRTSTQIKEELQFAGTASTVKTALKVRGDMDWSLVQASKGAKSSNLQHAVLNIDPSTGLGTASYSWQALGTDSYARTFNAYTTSSSGTKAGCGFFGFGSSFKTTGPTDNAIDSFICAWSPPSPVVGKTPKLNFAQKQCMTQDTSLGLYVPVSASDAITYAPVPSCDSSDANFAYGLTSSQDSSWIVTNSSSVTDNLVDLTADTDFANYSAPTAPTTP